jgi:hypothetical protein
MAEKTESTRQPRTPRVPGGEIELREYKASGSRTYISANHGLQIHTEINGKFREFRWHGGILTTSDPDEIEFLDNRYEHLKGHGLPAYFPQGEEPQGSGSQLIDINGEKYEITKEEIEKLVQSKVAAKQFKVIEPEAKSI